MLGASQAEWGRTGGCPGPEGRAPVLSGCSFLCGSGREDTRTRLGGSLFWVLGEGEADTGLDPLILSWW